MDIEGQTERQRQAKKLRESQGRADLWLESVTLTEVGRWSQMPFISQR